MFAFYGGTRDVADIYFQIAHSFVKILKSSELKPNNLIKIQFPKPQVSAHSTTHSV